MILVQRTLDPRLGQIDTETLQIDIIAVNTDLQRAVHNFPTRAVKDVGVHAVTLGHEGRGWCHDSLGESGAFRIVRNKETHEIVAFMSPLVGDRFVPTEKQEIEEPVIPYDIFECKVNALANDNDRDKISENQRQHKYSIDMHVLLAGNVPKFHITASDEALARIRNGLMAIFNDPGCKDRYFGEFIQHYINKYSVTFSLMDKILIVYIEDKLTDHMARRVGIENWPPEAILKWLDYYFGANRLAKVVTEAHEVWLRHQEKLEGMPVPAVFK